MPPFDWLTIFDKVAPLHRKLKCRLDLNRLLGIAGIMSKPAQPKRYLIHIELKDVHLPIWREVIIPADISLEHLDEVIQRSMGWSNEQLHVFIKNGVRFESADASFNHVENPEDEVDLNKLLEKVGDSMQYVYDLDEEWTHALTLKEVLPWDDDGIFVCTDGNGACPCEDCGGAAGHEEACLSGEIRYPEAFEPKKATQRLFDFLDFLQHEDEAYSDLFDEIAADGLFDEDLDSGVTGHLFDGIEDEAMEQPRYLKAGVDDDDDELEEIQPPYENLSNEAKGLFQQLFFAGEAVRAAEPWKDLWDQDVFCVKDPETGLLDFVSVLGRGGEVFAVHVHRAPECYNYWRQTKEGTLPVDSMEDFLRLVRMTELELVNKSEMEDEDLSLYEELGYRKPARGNQKWMRMRRYHPRSVPYFPQADQLPSLIRGAQLAVRFVTAVRAEPNRAQSKWIETGEKSVGLPKELPVFTIASNRNVNDWAAWELENREIDWSPKGLADGSYQPSEFDLERVALLPESSQPWEVGAMHTDKTFASEAGPVFPVFAMAAPTARGGEPPEPHISSNIEESLGQCIWQAFVNTASARGERPKQLNVTTDLAEKTFQPLADHCGMKLKRVKQLELISQFFQFMRESL